MATGTSNLRPLLAPLAKIIRGVQSQRLLHQGAPALSNRQIKLAQGPESPHSRFFTNSSTAFNTVEDWHTPTVPEGKIHCTLIPGDGIGPEMMNCMQEVVEATGAPIEFDNFFLSDIQYRLSSNIDDVVDSVKKNAVCIKGILTSPTTGEGGSLNYQFRSKLDLFANTVHIISIPGVPARHSNLDFIVVREQTEGEFSSMEHESVPGVVECLKIVTEEKSRRIAKFAFDYATNRDRKKVTAVHKANIMKLGDGLFLECCKEIASLYPKIKFENMIVDNCTMQMTSHPQQFDVMVMGNLYGSIVDNVASGLVGGAGVVAGASYSNDTAVFEPGARHTFSEAVGKEIANPTAYIICAAKMLHHVNLKTHARKIFGAIYKVLEEGKFRTKDLGGQSSTGEYTRAIIKALN